MLVAAVTLPSQLPYLNHRLCIVLKTSNTSWVFSLIFYGCLRLQFLDVETNPGPHRPVPAVSRILCSNAQGLAGNLSDLTVASSQYDILLCSETLASDMRHVSEVLVPSFGDPVLLCQGTMPRAHGMAAYVRDGYRAFRQPKFECGCCKMMVFRVCDARQNLHVYSLYRNPDLDDRIFDCLVASMAAVQGEDVRAISLVQYGNCLIVTFGFLTILLRF